MSDHVDVPGRLIRLASVPGLPWLPLRGDTPISLSTVHRWVSEGVRGLKLRTVRVGRSLCTTEAWLLEFFERLNEPTTTAAPRARHPREAARERARRELEVAGI